MHLRDKPVWILLSKKSRSINNLPINLRPVSMMSHTQQLNNFYAVACIGENFLSLDRVCSIQPLRPLRIILPFPTDMEFSCITAADDLPLKLWTHFTSILDNPASKGNLNNCKPQIVPCCLSTINTLSLVSLEIIVPHYARKIISKETRGTRYL